MESLEKLQKRLSTLHQLSSIVKTMKALSAANIRQYEQSVEALSSYQQSVERGLHVLVKDSYPLELNTEPDETRPTAAIIFGSDHGLCGRFNEVISEFSVSQLIESRHNNVRLMTVGARVVATLQGSSWPIEQQLNLPSSSTAITRTVQEILLKIDQWRQDQVENVNIYYNQRSKGQGYKPFAQTLLPIRLMQFKHLPEGKWPSRRLPIYKMPHDELLSKLIHQYLFVSLFRACAESQASEHASRLSAMQSAQRNLDDHLSDVSMDYRHARQAEITTELLDIFTGFETIVAGN